MDEYTKVKEQIKTAKKAGQIVLIPSIPLDPPENPLFIPVLEEVFISSDVKNGREVYPGTTTGSWDNKKVTGYRLSASALRKVANAGAIRWVPTQSGFIRSGNGSVGYRAVGGVIKADGTPYQIGSYYEMNLEVVRQNLEEEYEGKRRDYDRAKKDWWKNKTPAQKKEYIEGCINRDFRQKRQFQVQLCETGAKTRVIREIFNMKGEYSPEELHLPFLVLKFAIQMNSQDPEIRRAILGVAVQSAFGIYGPPTAPAQITGPEPIDMRQDPNMQAWAAENEYDPDAPASENGEEPDGELMDFENAGSQDQTLALKELAQRKGFKELMDFRKGGKEKLGKRDLFIALRELPDKSIIPDDDIPY